MPCRRPSGDGPPKSLRASESGGDEAPQRAPETLAAAEDQPRHSVGRSRYSHRDHDWSDIVMNQKYELTDETVKINSVILHRIMALTDFGEVNAGDLGGWVESERNLSHDGNAWVYDNAWVYGNAWVGGNARVCGNAWVDGNDHLLQVGPIGSRNEYTTFFRAKDTIGVACGCYQGLIDNFENRVREVHGDSKYGKEYQIAIELAKCHIDLS